MSTTTLSHPVLECQRGTFAVNPSTVAIARPAAIADPFEWVSEFPHQSVFLLALLTTVTNGLYLAFWFHRQSRILDRVKSRSGLEPAWLTMMWMISGLSAGWIVIESLAGASPTVWILGMIVDNLAALVFVTLAFQLRTRLNSLACEGGDGRRSAVSFSRLGTFAFNVLYLQRKINHLRLHYRPNCCRTCGYDLRGLTMPRCPECGTAFNPLLLETLPDVTARSDVPAPLTSQ
jgi:hypothetical protein